jgi:hypothetical protein
VVGRVLPARSLHGAVGEPSRLELHGQVLRMSRAGPLWVVGLVLVADDHQMELSKPPVTPCRARRPSQPLGVLLEPLPSSARVAGCHDSGRLQGVNVLLAFRHPYLSASLDPLDQRRQMVED